MDVTEVSIPLGSALDETAIPTITPLHNDPFNTYEDALEAMRKKNSFRAVRLLHEAFNIDPTDLILGANVYTLIAAITTTEGDIRARGKISPVPDYQAALNDLEKARKCLGDVEESPAEDIVCNRVRKFPPRERLREEIDSLEASLRQKISP